jgi:hypothetical protein
MVGVAYPALSKMCLRGCVSLVRYATMLTSTRVYASASHGLPAACQISKAPMSWSLV